MPIQMLYNQNPTEKDLLYEVTVIVNNHARVLISCSEG